METKTFAATSEADARSFLLRYYSGYEILDLCDTGKKGHPAVRGTLWTAKLQEK